MSHEAVTWSMDDAPMLRTPAGKPDTTARHVLQVLAEHAGRDGRDSHPSLLRIQYRTGYDRRTVQRALRRLEGAGLILRDGSVDGRTRWRLPLEVRRPSDDWATLEAEAEADREAAAERKRRSRANDVTHSEDVTVTHSESVTGADVTDADDVTNGDVTHSTPGRHALKVRTSRTQRRPNRPSTVLQPSVLPETTSPAPEGAATEPDSGGTVVHLPRIDEPETAQTILAAYIDWRGSRPPGRITGQLAKHLGELIADNIPPDLIKRGLAEWHGSNTHPASMPSFVDAVVRRHSQTQPTPGAGDQRVAAHLDVAARLRAAEQNQETQ